MQPAKRVVKNTGFLYVRMIITIIVSLYSTRLILSALGESDYGIFSLIAGVIALLSLECRLPQADIYPIILEPMMIRN